MVNVLTVIGSPDPGSFVHALAREVTAVLRARGDDVEERDLYAEQFPPVAPPGEAYTAGLDVEAAVAATADPLVRRHRLALSRADLLVVAHPNWWGKPPAIMAGWIDRVVVPGVAYRLERREGLPTSLLRLRGVLVLNTGDTPPEREREVFGDPRSQPSGHRVRDRNGVELDSIVLLGVRAIATVIPANYAERYSGG